MTSPSAPIASLVWPSSRAGEALESIVRVAGRPARTFLPGHASLEDAARELGLEAEPLSVRYGDIDVLLGTSAPALLRIAGASPSDEHQLIALLDANTKRAHIVTPDHTVRTVALATLRDALYGHAEGVHGARIEGILARTPLSSRDRTRARAALLREQVRELPLDAGWALRISPATPFLDQLRSAGVIRMLRATTIAHAVSFALSLLAWWVIGRGALSGHLDRGWLYAWALVLATLVPIRVLTAWWQGIASVRAGLLLKQRMLLGALNLVPDAIRSQGTGQLLGRVIEVDAVEDLAMHGGFVSLVALVELGIAVPVLALGPSGLASVLAFVAWLAFAGSLIYRFARRWLAWSHARITMTQDMVEGMLGHRTRVAQEDSTHWHDGEDRALAAYAEATRALDRVNTAITGLLPRGWMLLGFAALAPAFMGGAASPEKLAVGIGGVLLARSALMRITAGLTSLVGALAAWKHAAPLFDAAACPKAPASARIPPVTTAHDGAELPEAMTLLDVRHLDFRYRPEAAPVLRDVTFRIRHGERILVEGPSGSGKSTFGSVLAGLRTHDAGLVLLRGLDQKSLGAPTWRRHIAAAPQFHENHILSETLAFNVLLGRRWPPRREDLHEAETVCRELGLGPVLEKMPGGLMERVGETGWQLSHGERSRVYLARALLQGAELVILDESFASLDPETQKQALECAMKRAPSLVVIAHP
ncbi:ABC transporter ATP-binding protein/permease [Pendulispora brunnea]|uniref:ABC transporter ATP-binding protein/permease n=1 Tax=Pendulispora brunnea TaxID=2905690 RepID=A0ABZ2KC93_9BACT